MVRLGSDALGAVLRISAPRLSFITRKIPLRKQRYTLQKCTLF